VPQALVGNVRTDGGALLCKRCSEGKMRQPVITEYWHIILLSLLVAAAIVLLPVSKKTWSVTSTESMLGADVTVTYDHSNDPHDDYLDIVSGTASNYAVSFAVPSDASKTPAAPSALLVDIHHPAHLQVSMPPALLVTVTQEKTGKSETREFDSRALLSLSVCVHPPCPPSF